MLLNWELRLVGANVVLVPYRRLHVEVYHRWMSSADLLEFTASEPLSLAEELVAQAGWWQDPMKLTFIIMAVPDSPAERVSEIDSRSIQRMAGDVNVFYHGADFSEGEIEIMIAEPSFRRRGMAEEAVRLMMEFAFQRLGTKRFLAKIGEANVASLNLFECKLGFENIGFVDAFKEHQLLKERGEDQDELVLDIRKDADLEQEACEINKEIEDRFGTNLPEVLPAHIGEYSKKCASLVIDAVKETGVNLDKALNVACGVGAESFALSEEFKKVKGIDESPVFIARAQLFQHGQIKVPGNEVRKSNFRVDFALVQDLRRLDGLQHSFDAIVVSDALFERSSNPDACLNQFFPSTGLPNPNGCVIALFTRHDETHIVDIMKSQEGIKHLSTKDVPFLIVRQQGRKYDLVIVKALLFHCNANGN